MMRGKRAVLTAADPANGETARSWVNDPDVNVWLEVGHVPVTHAAELAWYGRAEQDGAAGTAHQFEIHAADDMRLLGMCGLVGIDRFDRHSEAGIFIGGGIERGKGFGRDALVTLLRFAFETLGLNTVRIRVIEGNDEARALYQSVGFSDVGVLREGRYVRGQFHDVLLLDMTRGDFDTRYAS